MAPMPDVIEGFKRGDPDAVRVIYREHAGAVYTVARSIVRDRELAADGLSFDDVARDRATVSGVSERRRWEVLATLQRAYLDALSGLEMWDRQTARLYAIEHRECRTDRDVILVGAVDLNGDVRALLATDAEREWCRIRWAVSAGASA